ncbi:hypothetical protein R3P38DRAFT_3231263 [Favolaschia claudopus]|uniref:AAA+ ATPase domain-containing protein n=1 Tax=Favolaschia claudopus TaxID=2862362 RepID=A0AAV9ZKU1_9AGAR
MFPTLVVLISLTVLAFSLYDKSPVAAAVSFVKRTSATPLVTELLRFIFLGTIVGAGRQLGDMIVKLGLSLLVVEAEFSTNDFAYDWVLSYLENNRVWKESRFFKVVARISVPRIPPTPSAMKMDGHPDALYEPASLTPSVFQWQGYWISKKTVTGQSHFTTGQEMGGTLTIRIWSRNRQALDDFVQAARKFYIDSDVPPRKLDRECDRSGGLVTALFHQGDLSYDWMLAFLRSVKVLQDFQDYSISTKQSDLDWGNGPQDLVRYLPAHDTKQQLLFTSPRTGKKTWLQFVVAPGHHNRSSSVETGGSITVMYATSTLELYSVKKSSTWIFSDYILVTGQPWQISLIQAHKIYVEHGVSNVSVRLTDNKGRWAKTLTKNRRAFPSLILPEGIKETLVSDAKQFLESEKWYNEVGVPHRRGYLLYGEPGTGKSTTIHVLAGELGLDIYFISLASPGIDDYSLAKLINDTPSRCILLLEDIDCAFPSRDDTYGEDEDEDTVFDKDGQPVTRSAPPKSAVTLSGLLNVLDSVSSGEGRLTFGTTNHIENLDSALIRAVLNQGPTLMDSLLALCTGPNEVITPSSFVCFATRSPGFDSAHARRASGDSRSDIKTLPLDWWSSGSGSGSRMKCSHLPTMNASPLDPLASIRLPARRAYGSTRLDSI